VETKKNILLQTTKYIDYFYVVNANYGDSKYFIIEGGSFEISGTIDAGKVLAYKSLDK
jgi:hypothetical protein